jgi:predicted anti-sigma-YlaC factor YlaD
MEGSSEAEGIHARVQAGFSAYLDGEMAGNDRRVVDEHLAICIQCRTELTRLRAAVQQLGAMRERAPQSFLADIQKQIHTRSKGRFFGRRRLLFGRIPFERVSLAMIDAMLVYYIVPQHASPTPVAPGP